jgi:hypothetical protein
MAAELPVNETFVELLTMKLTHPTLTKLLTVLLLVGQPTLTLCWTQSDNRSGNVLMPEKHGHVRLKVDNLFGSSGQVSLEVIPGRQKDLDELGGKTIPARVCTLGKPAISCYIARARGTNFARKARVFLLQIEGGRALVLFQADYWLVNDKLRFIALLGMSDDGKIVDVLPSAVFSLQGQFRIWQDEQISSSPLVTVTDYYTTAMPPEETHFSYHHYRISTYEFCPQEKRYRRVDRFLTSRKFPGFDGPDHPGDIVLKAMMAQVRSRLMKHQQRAKDSVKCDLTQP